MKKDLRKVPSKALSFSEQAQLKLSEQENGEEEKERKLSMVGYSGGVITDHWWWGNLVIDLEGMAFPKSSYPILYEHDTSKRLAFTKKPNLDDYKLQVNEAVLLKNETVDTFLVDADQGFPFEASIRVDPSSIEYVSDGETVDVNGFKFKGPGTVFRKSTFKEVSVCVFGWDSNTSSVAMSEGDAFDLSSCVMTKNKNTSEGVMDWTKFKEEQPDEYNAFAAEIEKSVSAKFASDIKSKDDMIVELTNKCNKLSEEKSASESTMLDRVADMEKKFALQNEQIISNTVSNILSVKFSDSNIPQRIQEKITKLVDYNKFVKNDVFDREAFSAAVDKEIAEFSEVLPKDSTIIGFGSREKNLGDAETFSDDDAEKLATSMLAFAGVNLKK